MELLVEGGCICTGLWSLVGYVCISIIHVYLLHRVVNLKTQIADRVDLQNIPKSKISEQARADMRPSFPRSKFPLAQYCANCRSLASFSPSSLNRQLAACLSRSLPQPRPFPRSFHSSAHKLYAVSATSKLPSKIKAKSPVLDDQQLSQWEAK
jgi:hypothetical protein